jgi:hypothetical protein
MLSSISPLGERARGSRWWRTTTSYVIASVIGGAALGAALGGLGGRVGGSRALVVVAAAVAVLGAALEPSARVPTWHRQVDENWLVGFRDWVYGAGYGFQLGLGTVTVVTSAVTYLTWLLELVAGSWYAGAVIGATFGLLRGLPLLAMAGAGDVATLRRRNASIVAREPAVRRVTAIGQLTAAAGLLAVAVVG